ncbi:hypothetical protein H311_01472 [Anncaliia algerae PRA109]|nr:hypothetical protein H311_01472 [Anncaliia algerae PRA109]
MGNYFKILKNNITSILRIYGNSFKNFITKNNLTGSPPSPRNGPNEMRYSSYKTTTISPFNSTTEENKLLVEPNHSKLDDSQSVIINYNEYDCTPEGIKELCKNNLLKEDISFKCENYKSKCNSIINCEEINGICDEIQNQKKFNFLEYKQTIIIVSSIILSLILICLIVFFIRYLYFRRRKVNRKYNYQTTQNTELTELNK